MSQLADQGFGPVLANRDFRSLWMAQLLAQTSQQAINFIQMVLIERLTGSAVHLGLVILAFSLPGVIFSPVAGVMVDRVSKKLVLVGSNALRVLLTVAYIAVLALPHSTWQLLAIYAIAFLTATLGQFFAPAEAASIPLLVGEDRLMAANSLFNLTMAVSQVVGLLMLGPLAVSLVKVEGGFVMLAALYLGATILVAIIPKDVPPANAAGSGVSRWLILWEDAREGWQFVTGQSKLLIALTQQVAVTTLVMVMAMLAPGYATRVLGMEPENAIILFAPAGVGMLLATGIVGRWGHVLRRLHFDHIGLVLVGLAFAGLGLLSMDYQRLLRPILGARPPVTFSMTGVIMVMAFVLGSCLSGVSIMAQTILQQDSPAYIRGRVFSVLFMLSNLIGIPPMLALGGAADIIGIPNVLGLVGAITVIVAGASSSIGRAGAFRRRLRRGLPSGRGRVIGSPMSAEEGPPEGE